jgi:hypothetical protein
MGRSRQGTVPQGRVSANNAARSFGASCVAGAWRCATKEFLSLRRAEFPLVLDVNVHGRAHGIAEESSPVARWAGHPYDMRRRERKRMSVASLDRCLAQKAAECGARISGCARALDPESHEFSGLAHSSTPAARWRMDRVYAVLRRHRRPGANKLRTPSKSGVFRRRDAAAVLVTAAFDRCHRRGVGHRLSGAGGFSAHDSRVVERDCRLGEPNQPHVDGF